MGRVAITGRLARCEWCAGGSCALVAEEVVHLHDLVLDVDREVVARDDELRPAGASGVRAKRWCGVRQPSSGSARPQRDRIPAAERERAARAL